ncbi:MAG: GTP cyclohydrolase I FolE [Bdellovibrio sp.]
MSYEKSFNLEFAKKLAKVDNPESWLEDEMGLMKQRLLELNAAREEMRTGFQKVLEGLKKAFPQIDLSDPNFLDTPNRMSRALLEICSGLGVQDKEIFSTHFPSEGYNQVVILKNIEFTSLCSHHFYPFTGTASVGYLPKPHGNGKVVGLSKLARIVDAHAQRPQLQERMSQGIMDAITEQLDPDGVMVVIEAQHGCLTCRGAKKINASMVTSSLSGKFKNDQKLREEFLMLIK